MNIIGKIELPPREIKINVERYHDFLLGEMSSIKNEVNGKFGDFLDDEANIKIFSLDNNDAENDKQKLRQKEEVWANEQHKDLATWQRDKERNPANIAEMAITLVLHRFLKDRFIVARASKYDDYEHGVDNVIIDKETGVIICGFDEVIDFDYRTEENKKVKKVKNSLEHGGTEIKYGATVIDGELQRKSFRNIPTFYLSLFKKDLDKLLLSLQNNQGKSEESMQIINKLVESLEEQHRDFSTLNLSNNNLKNNFDKFSDSLSVIKNLIQQ